MSCPIRSGSLLNVAGESTSQRSSVVDQCFQYQKISDAGSNATNIDSSKAVAQCVQVRKFKEPITLEKLKGLRDKHEELKDLQLFSTSRLSVQNVTHAQWEYILSLECKSND
jgi:predicted RNA-binding protein with PUA-like domain